MSRAGPRPPRVVPSPMWATLARRRNLSPVPLPDDGDLHVDTGIGESGNEPVDLVRSLVSGTVISPIEGDEQPYFVAHSPDDLVDPAGRLLLAIQLMCSPGAVAFIVELDEREESCVRDV